MEEEQVVAEYVFDWRPYHQELSEAQIAVGEQVRNTEQAKMKSRPNL